MCQRKKAEEESVVEEKGFRHVTRKHLIPSAVSVESKVDERETDVNYYPQHMEGAAA